MLSVEKPVFTEPFRVTVVAATALAEFVVTAAPVSAADAIPSPANGAATVTSKRAGRDIRRNRFITVRQSQSGSRRIQSRSLLRRRAVVLASAVNQKSKLGCGSSTHEPIHASASPAGRGSGVSFGVPIRLSTAPKPFGLRRLRARRYL